MEGWDWAWERILDKGSQELVMEIFSVEGGTKYLIQGEIFKVGLQNWAIWFYPRGRRNGGQHASLYLRLKSKTVRLKSRTEVPVQFLYELLLLDQSGKGNNQGVSTFKGMEVDSLTFLEMTGIDKLVHSAHLTSPGSDYVRNNCVRIRATLAVYKNFVAKKLGRLLETKQWADVTIKVGDEETFSAHKLILAARCPALLSLQTQSHDDSIILLPHIQPSIFKVVLTFIYIQKLSEDEQKCLLRILAVAQLLELKTLKDICESRLSAAFMDSNGSEHKENNSLKLAPLRDNPSINIKGVFDMFNKALSIVKKSIVEDAYTYKRLKKKED